ncbi:MAG: alpha/beta hydrolase, partial [Proteobacteria bacterium]|nr:alpha/beta hydrolase [Pseudomonadota bacterium]
KKIFLVVALLILLAVGARFVTAMPSSDTALHVEGTGPVTVVFEAGLGDTSEAWQSVQLPVAEGCARTVSYTRRGYRGVERTAGARDARQVVEGLRSRLKESGVQPPYVLVGHSLGGLYMQYFARAYPKEVRGLLLVDSMHKDQLNRVRATTPGVYRMLNVTTFVMGGAMRQEFVGIPSSAAEIKALPHAGQVETIVLSSTQPSPGESPAFRTLWKQLQDEIAADYSAGRHEFVANSGHYIQRDQPQSVIVAARELAGCPARAMNSNLSLE